MQFVWLCFFTLKALEMHIVNKVFFLHIDMFVTFSLLMKYTTFIMSNHQVSLF